MLLYSEYFIKFVTVRRKYTLACIIMFLVWAMKRFIPE